MFLIFVIQTSKSKKVKINDLDELNKIKEAYKKLEANHKDIDLEDLNNRLK